MCTHSPEGQLHSGLHQKSHGQQVEGGDSPTPLSWDPSSFPIFILVNCLWSHNLIMLYFILKIKINTAACKKDRVKNPKNSVLYIHHQVPLSNITFITFKVFEIADPWSWQGAIIEITNFYSRTWNILAKQWKEKKDNKKKTFHCLQF